MPDTMIQSLINPSVEEIAREVIATAKLPLARAVTLPRQAYIDPAYFAYEAETVLKTDWICVAHVSQIAERGAFLAMDFLGEPILVIRGREDGVVRVLSRVCPHRAMDIMPDTPEYPRQGIAGKLVCNYHRWSFDSDGALRGCPEMHEAEGFDKADWRLPEIRSEIWHGFIFVNLDGTASPVAEQYAEVAEQVAPWNIDDMTVEIALDWDVPINWKVMMENFLESYHHLGAHHTTLNPIMPAKETYSDHLRAHFIRCHLPYSQEMRDQIEAERAGGPKLPGFPPLPGLTLDQEAEWGLWVGMPCFLFLTARDRTIWFRVLPVSVDRCLVQTTTLVAPSAKADPNYAETLAAEEIMLSDFHKEDMAIVPAVQRGLASSRAVRGRLSHLEKPIWQFQRYLAARARGTYPETEEPGA